MECEDWGLIEYRKALSQQLRIVQRIKNKKQGKRDFQSSERLIFCSHNPVVTFGRSTEKKEFDFWQGPKVMVSRGGKATFHGPSQIMVYSILNLESSRIFLKAKDVFSYLRFLEAVFIETLKKFGVDARSYPDLEFLPEGTHFIGNEVKGVRFKPLTLEKERKKNLSFTGVWVGGRKLVSIGVAFKNWISYHGACINFEKDSEAFRGIRPCGFSPQTMVSLEEILGQKIDRTFFKDVLKDIFFSRAISVVS